MPSAAVILGKRITAVLRIPLLLCGFLLTPTLCFAVNGNIAIVLSHDTTEYQTIAAKIREGLRDSRHFSKSVQLLSIGQIGNRDLKVPPVANLSVIVSIGVKALKAVLAAPALMQTPVYAVFVPRLSFDKLLQKLMQEKGAEPLRQISALYLDQPVMRQMRLAKRLNSQFVTAGVLVGKNTLALNKALERAASKLDFKLVEIRPQNSRKIIPELNRVTRKLDFLLTIFDPDIISRNSAKQILYYAYNRHLPVIGYSQAMVRAGAVAAVYSSTEQIGKEAARLLVDALDSEPVKLPETGYPDHYQAICNPSVARYFQIKLNCDLTTFSHSGDGP